MSARNLLEKIQVKSPCPADWDSMIGTDQVRFCEHCNQSVHNLSQMTRKRAMRLVANSSGRLCVRYYRHPDGSIVSKSVSRRLARIGRRASRVAAGAFTATLSLSSAVAQGSQSCEPNEGFSNVSASRQSGCPAKQTYLGGSIIGPIQDTNGALIPGATIAISNSQSHLALVTSSNYEGEYRFESLEPGAYSLGIEAPGFAPRVVGNIVLRPSVPQRLNQTLEVAGIQEEVEIEAGETVVMGGMAFVEPVEPLVKAAQEDDLLSVEALLAGNNVNARDKHTGTTALEHAVRNGNREMVQALISAGVDVGSRNDNRETVLMMLGEDATSDIAWDLINAGAKIDLKDSEGDAALFTAASCHNLSVLNTLLQAGAKVNDKNDRGQTALMMAASAGLMGNVRALVAAGADINPRDKVGKTALDYARENDHNNIVRLLQSFGADERVVSTDQ
jgi:hypothetical protein